MDELPHCIRIDTHDTDTIIKKVFIPTDTYIICKELKKETDTPHVHIALWSAATENSIRCKIKRNFPGGRTVYSMTSCRSTTEKYLSYMAKDCNETNPWITNSSFDWEHYLQLWIEEGEKIHNKRLYKCRNEATDTIVTESKAFFKKASEHAFYSMSDEVFYTNFLVEVIGYCIKYNGLAPHPNYLKQILATIDYDYIKSFKYKEKFIHKHYSNLFPGSTTVKTTVDQTRQG